VCSSEPLHREAAAEFGIEFEQPPLSQATIGLPYGVRERRCGHRSPAPVMPEADARDVRAM
jgi:hypothetical protein